MEIVLAVYDSHPNVLKDKTDINVNNDDCTQPVIMAPSHCESTCIVGPIRVYYVPDDDCESVMRESTGLGGPRLQGISGMVSWPDTCYLISAMLRKLSA